MLTALLMLFIVGLLGTSIVTALRGGGGRSSEKELQDLRERMLRLEQSVETMTGEMERVSEGQRFMTALLEDRARGQSALKPAPPGEAKLEG